MGIQKKYFFYRRNIRFDLGKSLELVNEIMAEVNLMVEITSSVRTR